MNSVERATELQRLVAQAIPDAALTNVEAGAFDPTQPVRTPDDRQLDPSDPEVRSVLAEVVAAYEQQWLDQPIPALGGQTHREAAGDPIGREQLTQLLASFPTPGPDDVGVMDPDRLRAALDLCGG